MKAKPLALWVSRSRARKTLVTRPKRSKRSRNSFSSANSLTCLKNQYRTKINDPDARRARRKEQNGRTYVCNSESRQIVLLETTAHLLAATSTALPHVRRNVAGLSSTKTTCILLCLDTRSSSSALLDGSHGVLEGTASREMLSTANTTLDLLVLQLILHAALLATLLLSLLSISLPVDAGAEDDVLADGGGVERGTGGVALLETELLPFAAFGDLGVDVFADNGGLNSAGDLDFLVVVIVAVGNDGLGAVLVGDHFLRREDGGVIEIFVVGPVGAAVK
jgi:hypothetical protein